MKLSNFKKNKKAKVIMGLSFVAIAGVAALGLYRSYALYETKKEYNVIKGTVQGFGYDVKLSFTIDKHESTGNFPLKDSEYVGTSVSCKNGVTAEWDNISWSLKNISNVTTSDPIKCTVDFKTKETFSEKVKPGDYVKMPPAASKFTVKKELTGYENDQEIEPQELDLWRVLRINEDGTIDLISEYTSSNKITFKGEAGYKNYVGTLNVIASAYTNSKYTVGSRYPGYNGQTEFVTAQLDSNLCNASSWQENESQGATDWYYGKDINLMISLNFYTTKDVKTLEETRYWVAGRWCSAYVYTGLIDKPSDSGQPVGVDLYKSDGTDVTSTYAVRPIVILRANLTTKIGNGSEEEPWTFE